MLMTKLFVSFSLLLSLFSGTQSPSQSNEATVDPALLQTEKVFTELMKGNDNFFILSKDGVDVTNIVLEDLSTEIAERNYEAISEYIFDHWYTMYEINYNQEVSESSIEKRDAYQYVMASSTYNGSFVSGYYKEYYNETRTFTYKVVGEARYLADPDGFNQWDSSYYPRATATLLTYFDRYDTIYTNSVSVSYSYDVAKINCNVYYRKVSAAVGIPDYTQFLKSITLNVKAPW